MDWTRTEISTSKHGVLSYNLAHDRRSSLSTYILGLYSPPQLLIQSTGIMNGACCSVCLFPSSKSAIVVRANGITDSDAADWISKLFTQALFDLEPKMDVILEAQKEAIARQEDFARLLRDWTKNRRTDEIEESINLDEYIGNYSGLGTVLTISRAEPDGDCGELQVMFNNIAESTLTLEFYTHDTFSWFPPSRDEWLKRQMIDWDFWRTGIFEFVRCGRREGNEVEGGGGGT